MGRDLSVANRTWGWGRSEGREEFVPELLFEYSVTGHSLRLIGRVSSFSFSFKFDR